MVFELNCLGNDSGPTPSPLTIPYFILTRLNWEDTRYGISFYFTFYLNIFLEYKQNYIFNYNKNSYILLIKYN